MSQFQHRISDFSHSMLARIDDMEWLEFSQHPAINDVNQFMGYISRWPLFVHMISATLCLGFSACFHLCFVYSPKVQKILSKLDYAGIIILIFGSSMPPIQYYFSCGPAVFWKNFLTILMLVSSTLTFVVTMSPNFDKKENRKFRGFLFIFLGLCGGSILVVLTFFRDPKYVMEPIAFDYAIGGFVYILGTSLYVSRIPERCGPGHFNIFGHSH